MFNGGIRASNEILCVQIGNVHQSKKLLLDGKFKGSTTFHVKSINLNS